MPQVLPGARRLISSVSYRAAVRDNAQATPRDLGMLPELQVLLLKELTWYYNTQRPHRRAAGAKRSA